MTSDPCFSLVLSVSHVVYAAAATFKATGVTPAIAVALLVVPVVPLLLTSGKCGALANA